MNRVIFDHGMVTLETWGPRVGRSVTVTGGTGGNSMPSPGTIIAEFDNGQDALDFSRLKGTKYTVTPGVNLMFAVRVAELTELLPHGDSL